MDIHNLKILIVEDSYSFALELEMLLNDLNYSVIGTVDNSAEALETIYAEVPDLILMDIEIKGRLTGIDIAKSIKNLNIPVLFISSRKDEETYQAAASSNMLGFLVKPVEKISLRSAIHMAVARAFSMKTPNIDLATNQSSSQNNIITSKYYYFKKKETFYKVFIKDIAFIKSDDNYCETHTLEGEVFTSRITISKLEEMLPQDAFLRTHRQYIVQLDHISSVNFSDSTLIVAGKEIPVSRTKRKELTHLFKMIK